MPRQAWAAASAVAAEAEAEARVADAAELVTFIATSACWVATSAFSATS